LSPVTFLGDVIGTELSIYTHYILSMGGAFWIIQLIRKKKLGCAGFNFKLNNWRILPLISVTAVALLLGVAAPLSNLIPMPDFFKQAMAELAGQTGIPSFLLMVMAAPMFEELIFRGIMLDGFLKKYSPTKAIIWSSVLFGIVHLNPWQFVTGLVMGIFIGWVYYHTRSLTYAIIIHASANLSGFIMRLTIDSDEYMSSTSEVEFFGGTTNYVLMTVSCMVICLVSVFFLKREFKKEEPFKDDFSSDTAVSTTTI